VAHFHRILVFLFDFSGPFRALYMYNLFLRSLSPIMGAVDPLVGAVFFFLSTRRTLEMQSFEHLSVPGFGLLEFLPSPSFKSPSSRADYLGICE